MIKKTFLLISSISLLVSCDDGNQNTVNSALKNLTPKAVTATSGNAQVGLSWLLANGASSYNIYYSNTTGVAPGNGTLVTDVVTVPKYLHQNLINGKTYYYVITSVDASGNESPPSTEVSATPLAISPDLTQVPWGSGGFGGGGGYGGAGGVGGSNSVQPLTVIVSPPNGATGVPIQVPLVLTFNRAISPATISPTNIQVTNQQGNSVVMTSSSSDYITIVLTPLGVWKANQLHTVTIRNVMDTLGNVISPLISTFTTASAPSGAAGGGMTPGSPGGSGGSGGTGGLAGLQVPNGGSGGGGSGGTGGVGLLPAPTNVAVTAGSGQISVTWMAVPRAASYNVYYAAPANGTCSVTTNSPGKATVVSPPYVYRPDMCIGRTYCFAVAAVDSNSQEGTLSSSTPAVTATAVSGAPACNYNNLLNN
ncbi:MAG: Ig-like domain-containing protein [Deltaproteobacteria bacterium]|nr:Ig-like domain-containing protein [Deltaproteobacteria bacterium]